MPLLPLAACARRAAPVLSPSACGRPPPPQSPKDFDFHPSPRGRGETRRLSKEYSLAPLTEQGLLGHGAFGTVRVAHPRNGGPSVAVKCIPKDGERPQCAAMREAAIMQSLDHGSICRLEGVFEDAQNAYLVLEHIDGHELFDGIEYDGLGDERVAKDVMRQVLEALAHCHSRGVVHRDVKPENIMLERQSMPGEPRVAKLIDFGLAVRRGSARSEPLAGSEPYQAPEGHTCESWEPSADCWSAGVVMHVLLTGQLLPPAVAAGKEPLDTLSVPLRLVPQDALELLARLLEIDAEKRLMAAEAAENRWVQDSRGWADETLFDDVPFRRQTSSGSDSTASTIDRTPALSCKPGKAHTMGVAQFSVDVEDGSLSPGRARAASCDASSRPNREGLVGIPVSPRWTDKWSWFEVPPSQTVCKARGTSGESPRATVVKQVDGGTVLALGCSGRGRLFGNDGMD